MALVRTLASVLLVGLALTTSLASLAHGASVSSCTTGDVKIVQASTQGGLGSEYLQLSYTNRTRAACQTKGVPGVTLYGGNGQKITAAVAPEPNSARALVVRPGARVFSVVKWGEITVHPHQRCPSVAQVSVRLPGSQESARVALHGVGSYCIPPAYSNPIARTAEASLGAAGCQQIVWRSLRDGDQVCPTSHSILADVSWIELRWTRWGSTDADGSGVAVHYSTGARIDMRTPIHIRLYRVRACLDGARIYTRITLMQPKQSDATWTYSCGGSGGGGGG
jgi:hypothetical protein